MIREPSSAQVWMALCYVGANLATAVLVARYGLVGAFGSVVMGLPRAAVGVVALSTFSVCALGFALGLTWFVFPSNPDLPEVNHA